MSAITEEAARAICAEYDNRPDALIEILHDVQERCGYVPRERLIDIADALNVTRAEVYGVVTFYHDFRDAPPARRIVQLCQAEACQSVGCRALAAHARKKLGVDFGETTPDGEIELKEVFCLGDCALAPAAMIDGKLYGKLTTALFDQILGGEKS